jgi:acyl-CoA synthetase (AMP-forming)/AMP-acid ligase II
MTDFSSFTYPRLLQHQAETRPEQLAVVTPTHRVTWRQLRDDAARIGGGLLDLGIAPGSKVAILMANGYDWVAWAHAAAGVGAVVVPVNTRFRQQELAYQLKASDTHTLVLQPSVGDVDFLAMVLELVPELKSSPPGQWRSETFPALRCVVSVDDATTPAPGILRASNVAVPLTLPMAQWVREAQAAVLPQDPVVIQYTSGTTAYPKGAVLSHQGTARNAFHVNERLHINADDRIFVPGPFFHVGGSTLGMLLGLLSGAVIYALPRFNPATVLQIIEQEKITVYSGVDSLFLTLLKHPDFKRSALASVKKGWIASSPDLVRMVHREMGLEGIANVFGISEASPNVTICDLSESLELRAATCGSPHPDCEVRIVDPETGAVVPPGQSGEILFRGYSLMLGYYNNPEATAKAIDADGWLHTGDRGVLRPSGHLEYHGRIKDMLRVGGENLAPAEVEEVICQHPKVRQAAVVGLPDERLVEVPAAVVELKEGAQCTPEEITAYCSERLASFKVPRVVAFVDRMPMTGSGKIQKFSLRQDVFGVPPADRA